jgi:NAD-dependent SIR2 family protein deacetylase
MRGVFLFCMLWTNNHNLNLTNMNIPKKIKEAIETNKLVVFVGAGLSAKFGLPTWKKLVLDIINDLNEDKYKPFISLLQSDTMTAPEILEKLQDNNHGDIKKYIKENFYLRGASYDLKLHKNIIDLSGKIVTTNYDNAFEKASENEIIPTVHTDEFNISEVEKNDASYIFKIHGSCSEPNNCVIFQAQYEKLYSEDTATKEKLKTIFTGKTILFLGFSFADNYINIIFNNLDKAFDNNNKHFIMTKEPKDFSKFKFLECIDIKDFSQIDEFIDECLKYKNTVANKGDDT